MTRCFQAALLAAFLLPVYPALAQSQFPPLPPPPRPADMQRFASETCGSQTARIVIEINNLDTRMNLTAQQKTLFERWKAVKLNAAKSIDCTPPPMGPDMLVDAVKYEEKMLRQRHEEVKAELPSLQALVVSLNPRQKAILASYRLTPHRIPHGDETRNASAPPFPPLP